jgi:hypothetical protein
MSWFWPAFWWWDTSIYLVFSMFFLDQPPCPHQLKFACFLSVVFCYLPVDSHQQHKPETKESHSFQSHLVSLDCPNSIFWSEVEKQWHKESPCFRQFWIGKLSDKYLPVWTLLYVSCKCILISWTNFKGIANSVRMLYSTSLLTES